MAQILGTTDGRLPVQKFSPSMWTNTFTSFSADVQLQEKYGKEIEALKDEVRKWLIIGESNKQDDILILIDHLERLGIAYHFKQEIENNLQEIFNSKDNDAEDQLFTTALRFRLLRQHRHHVSSRVFDRFMGNDGKFDGRLTGDVQGLLSLYEAAHLRIHGEHILEEGLAFATHHLNLLAPKLEGALGDQVKRALQYPLQWSYRKIESRYYISFYERDDLRNEVLLKLAKLDFNYVQNLYKKELHDVCNWRDKFDLKSKLTYARDRVVESHFWSVGVVPEPQDSFARVANTKCIILTAILDDTYDNYATVEEAEVFTKALQRWDLNEIGHLPDYMKVVYSFIMSTYEDLQREASDCGKSFAVPYFREAIKELGQAYCVELKWQMGMGTPTIEAYNSNLIITSTLYTTFMPTLFGMESASDQVFKWLFTRPKLLTAVSMLGRYLDDLVSHEREVKRGQMLTGINIYMKHYGVTEQEAFKRFGELAEEAWMDINREYLNLPSTDVPHDVSNGLLDYARVIEIFYKHSDGYSEPGKFVAPEIVGLFINALVI